MAPDSSEIAGWELALHQGDRFIQHDEFLALFASRTAECEKAAIQRFVDHTNQWEDKVAEAAASPQRLFSQCQEKGKSYQQILISLADAEAKLASAEGELNQLRESASSDSTSRSLVPFICSNR